MSGGNEMNPLKEAIKKLKAGGYEFDRHGANHDLNWNKETNKKIPVKRHDFNENDLRYILKEAGLK